jgi:hypothetical protein
MKPRVHRVSPLQKQFTNFVDKFVSNRQNEVDSAHPSTPVFVTPKK